MWITELTTKTKTADTRIGNQSARIPVMTGMQACGRRQARAERTSRVQRPIRLRKPARRDSSARVMRHLALALATAAPFAAAQQQQTAQEPAPQPGPQADSFGHSRHGETFDDGPRQSAYLMAGMSAQVHFPVAGLDPTAHPFFDQGVTQQHGFWYFEAERSFRQVALLHPDCAMAYWGMAMANVENKPRAAGFAAHAVQRETTAAAGERMWIDALAGYYRIDAACRTELQSGDQKRADAARAQLATQNTGAARAEQPLAGQLVHDLEGIVHSYPADIEAKAFLAVQIWRNYEWGSGIPMTSRGAVDALLDQVLAAA